MYQFTKMSKDLRVYYITILITANVKGQLETMHIYFRNEKENGSSIHKASYPTFLEGDAVPLSDKKIGVNRRIDGNLCNKHRSKVQPGTNKNYRIFKAIHFQKYRN